jgi:biotin/methionine sulfoxide reductase
MTMTGDYSNQHLVPMKRVVAPRDEARDDFDVFADLSERWEEGARAFYRRENRSAVAGDLLSDCRATRASQQVTLPPFDQFWQANQLIEMPESRKMPVLPASRHFVPIRRPSAENRERQN